MAIQEKITFDKFIRWVTLALLLVAIGVTVNHLSGVLLPFFVAWLFAYLLYPMVKFVQHKLHIRIRAVAIIITMLFVILVIAGIIYLIIPPMIEQFQLLGGFVSRWLSQNGESNSLVSIIKQWAQDNRSQIDEFFRRKDFTEAVKAVMPSVVGLLSKTVNVLLSVVASCITLLYMFFILLDYEYLTTNWIRIFPIKARPFWREVMRDVERELNNYIRGQSMVALCMGLMFCIGFTIIDFPMAIGLGILIGILDLVPYLHTFALIPTAFLAMLKAADTGQNFWWVFGMAVAVFAIVQIISDMVVTPKIMGKAMRLNPAILLLSLSVWGALLGFIGLIIALPLTTILIAYYQRYITKDEVAISIEETPKTQQ